MPNFLNPSTSTIQATGGDYATPQLWEADTDNDLVTGTVSEIGLMAAETFAGVLEITGATTSVDYSRKLTYQVGDGPYDITTDAGPKLYKVITGDSGRNLYVEEQHFVVEGICVQTDSAGFTGIRAFWFSAASSGEVRSCVSLLTNSAASGWSHALTLRSDSPGAIATNCIAALYDAGTSSDVQLHGLVAEGGVTSILNGTSYGLTRGVFCGSGTTITNCVSIDSSEYCYSISGTASYCVSSDATASGTGSVTSVTAAAAFEDHTNLDFRPKDGGPLDDAGTDLSGTFTTDITGATRSLWSIGAYDAPPVVASTTAVIAKNHSTTEYIPAHFQFTAWESTLATGVLSQYGVKWTVSGGSEHDGTYTGPDLGMVWQTAGTFTVRLDILDDDGVSLSNASTTITVATPTFDNTIYVSSAGSDANDGLTSGAPKLTFAAAFTALKAAHTAGDHSRLLLSRGDTFTVSATQSMPSSTSGTFYFDAYGTGANPSIDNTNGTLLSSTNSSTTANSLKWRNIDVVNDSTAGLTFALYVNDDNAGDRGHDAVFCDFDWSCSAASQYLFQLLPFGTTGTQTAYGDWNGFAKQNNFAAQGISGTSTGAYYVYGFCRWFTVNNCQWYKPAGGTEHNIRMPWTSRASIRNSIQSSGLSFTTIIRISTGVQVGYGVNASSHEVTIADNTFEVGAGLAVQATYDELTAEIESTGRILVVNNKFIPHPVTPYVGSFNCIEGYGDQIAAVGNTVYGQSNFFLCKPSAGNVTTDPTHLMLVAGNSYSSPSGGEFLIVNGAFPAAITNKDNAAHGLSWFIRGASTAGEEALITSDNNVADVTNWANNVDSAGSRTLAQWQTDSSQDAASLAEDPAFTNPSLDNWAVGNANLIDAGTNLGASWLTRFGTTRTGTWDIGAAEYGDVVPGVASNDVGSIWRMRR